ncbi:MAG: hypothetical protein AAGA54_36735 [Myxococcota bacterium]
MRAPLRPLLLLLTVCAPACDRSSSDVPCATVAAHATELLGTPAGDVSAVRRELETTCATAPWSAEGRRCMAAAKDQTAYIECGREEKLRAGADLGGPDCKTVVAKLEARNPSTSDEDRESRRLFCRTKTRTFKECVLAIDDGLPDPDFFEAYGACSNAELSPAAS